jgi:hypothetical protein
VSTRLGLAAAIAVIPLLVYPLMTLAGGAPRFPSRDDCVHAPLEGQPADIVYGRFDDPVAAADLLERVLAVGFAGTVLQFDACGKWQVLLEDVPSVEIAREVQAEARAVGLEPTLERAGD